MYDRLKYVTESSNVLGCLVICVKVLQGISSTSRTYLRSSSLVGNIGGD